MGGFITDETCLMKEQALLSDGFIFSLKLYHCLPILQA